MKRNTDRSREENSTASPGKKPYSSPKLSEFGPVRQLTAGGTHVGREKGDAPGAPGSPGVGEPDKTMP